MLCGARDYAERCLGRGEIPRPRRVVGCVANPRQLRDNRFSGPRRARPIFRRRTAWWTCMCARPARSIDSVESRMGRTSMALQTRCTSVATQGPAAVAVIGDAASGAVGRSEGQCRCSRRGTVEAFLAHLPRLPLLAAARGPTDGVSGAHARAFLTTCGTTRRSGRGAAVARAAWIGQQLLRLDGAASRRHANDAGKSTFAWPAGCGFVWAKSPRAMTRLPGCERPRMRCGDAAFGACEMRGTVARAFVRYLAMEGRCRRWLEAAIFAVAIGARPRCPGTCLRRPCNRSSMQAELRGAAA
jgi:hypothetical protein